MVPGGFAEQVVDGRRRIVDGRAVAANDLAIDALERGWSFRRALTAEVDRHQVQARGRHLNGQPLDALAVAAGEQRGLPAGFGQVVDR